MTQGQRRDTRARRFVAMACVLLGLLFATQALAGGARLVKPGETPQVGPGEALLLFAVDSPWPLKAVKLDQLAGRDIATFAVPAGGEMQLYVVPVGAYRWGQLETYGFGGYYRYDFTRNKDMGFEVRAGQLNYPGTLVVRPYAKGRSPLSVANRGLAAMDWLIAKHPAIAGSATFAFAGHAPDPFPAFYRKLQEQDKAPPADADTTVPLPKGMALPLPIDELWQEYRIQDTALNPGGDLLAEAVLEKGKWGIDLFDLKAGTALRLLAPPAAVGDLEWLGDRTLAVDLALANGETFVSIVRIQDGGPKGRTFDVLEIPFTGFIVPGSQGDHVVFASQTGQGTSMLHRLDITSQDTINHAARPFQGRLNKGVANDVAWIVDRTGQVRMALGREDDKVTLYFGAAPDFQPVMTFEGDDLFQPYRLTPDGNRFYAVTDQGRAQRELVVFDPATKKVVETLFSRPGLDVESPLFDRDGRAIGVSYYRAGQLVSEYFDDDGKALAAQLAGAFPERNVAVIGRDAAGQQFILAVDGSDAPPALYHFDRQARRISLLDDYSPQLARRKFAAAKLVRATGSDGLPIEAFLTLPAGNARHPLVVMAHGGPIGIADTRHFDPDVQMLVALGYAVLQVNFRGSDGYGRAYRDAGKTGYGTLIEEDIDAALKVALASYPLDEKRMCAFGASYGGYSSLVSAIRWPDRYRCIVSMAGVSDRLLFITASDTGRTRQGRERLYRVFGDPATQAAALMATSPLYEYEKLTTPLLLVHGVEDERVDFEHTARLVRVLSRTPHPPMLLKLEDTGHGWSDKARATFWPVLAAFLAQHLGTATPAAAPAAAAAAPAQP
jgi:dienelactone hydrolase